MIEAQEALLLEKQKEDLTVDMNQVQIPERVTRDEYDVLTELIDLRIWKIINVMTQCEFLLLPGMKDLLCPEEKILVVRIREAAKMCRDSLIPDPLPEDQKNLGDFHCSQ